MDENAHEAFDRLKEQGKVRFLGVSTHTPNLIEVANAAIESDRFDVMMLAYHFGAWPGLADVIDRAAAKDIGVVAMKTLRGSMHHGLDWSQRERESFTQASFKWVLSNPSVSCLVISLWNSGQLDEFLYASGRKPEAGDIAVLERYQELTAGAHCRQHCGRLPLELSGGRPDRRRAASPDVLRGVRRPEGSHASLRRPANRRERLPDVSGALHGRPARTASPSPTEPAIPTTSSHSPELRGRTLHFHFYHCSGCGGPRSPTMSEMKVKSPSPQT